MRGAVAALCLGAALGDAVPRVQEAYASGVARASSTGSAWEPRTSTSVRAEKL